MYADSVGNIGGFGGAYGFASSCIFQFVWHVWAQFAGAACMDMIVDGLPDDVYSFFPQHTGSL